MFAWLFPGLGCHHLPVFISSYLAGDNKLTKTSRHQRLNHLTSINVNFVHPDDGDVDLIWRISAETTAKISWGLVTPC
jgi:hypothetical protein